MSIKLPLDLCGIDFVVLLVGADKTDEHDFQPIFNHNYQPIDVTLDIKNNPIVRQYACITI